jgi:hypothetical protein
MEPKLRKIMIEHNLSFDRKLWPKLFLEINPFVASILVIHFGQKVLSFVLILEFWTKFNAKILHTKVYPTIMN